MFKKVEYRQIEGTHYKIGNDGTVTSDFNQTIKYFYSAKNKKMTRLFYDNKVVVLDIAEKVYETFTGKELGERSLYYKDGDASNCNLNNLSVLDGKFTELERKTIDNFTGLACILRKAGLDMNDFNFLKLYRNKDPKSMSVQEIAKWERIIFTLVDARRDFIEHSLVSKEIEELLRNIESGGVVKPIKVVKTSKKKKIK